MTIIKGVNRNIIRTCQILFIFNILFSEHTNGQVKDFHTLGVVKKYPLHNTIQFPTSIFYSSLKYPDIVFFNPDSSEIAILINGKNGIFEEYKPISKTTNVTSMTVGNINNDDIDDIIVVHRDQNLIEVLLSKKSDSSFSSISFQVNFYPEKVIVGDINNDRIPDIISFGKLSTGICVLQGKGNGKFQPKKTIFEDIPVGDFALVSLNADRIADIAVNNWLTNETKLYLGLGKLKFSEQATLSFEQDSVKTLFGDFNDDALADIAVFSAKNKTIQILQGDGLGNFSTTQTIATVIKPDNISLESFNKIKSSDIILNTNSSNMFSILINNGSGTFYDEIVFGKNQSKYSPIVADINSDGFADVLCTEEDSAQYSVFWNSQTKNEYSETDVSLAVGSMPTSLSVLDINNDGLDDIVVGNSESATISLFFSRTRSFGGQISIEVPERPSSVSFYSKTDSSITFFTTHQETPLISLFTMRSEGDSSFSAFGDIEQFSIPLPEKPITVLPDISSRQKGISLYAFMSTSNNAIVFYQQVKGTRFITKNLVPSIQSKILYATISDLDNDGNTDLSYLYNHEKSKTGILGISMNDSAGEFKGKIFQYQISDSLVRKGYIYFEDMNGDQVKDCIVYISPRNTIQLSVGAKENIFGQFEKIADNINIRIPEQLQINDFDNDGINDILYLNKDTSELFFLRGKGNGKFYLKKNILSLPKESTYRCGDFNGDKLTDIVYTNPRDHTITIRYGKNK